MGSTTREYPGHSTTGRFDGEYGVDDSYEIASKERNIIKINFVMSKKPNKRRSIGCQRQTRNKSWD
jgi:hypothetical protein